MQACIDIYDNLRKYKSSKYRNSMIVCQHLVSTDDSWFCDVMNDFPASKLSIECVHELNNSNYKSLWCILLWRQVKSCFEMLNGIVFQSIACAFFSDIQLYRPIEVYVIISNSNIVSILCQCLHHHQKFWSSFSLMNIISGELVYT